MPKAYLAIVLFTAGLRLLDAEDARTLADRANALLHDGKPGEAVQLFEQAVAADPQSSEVRFNLALAYFYNHQFEQSIRILSVSKKLGAEEYGLIGASYRALGKFDNAVSNLRRAVAIQPGNAHFVYDLGLTLVDSVKVDEAIRLLKGFSARPNAPAKIFGALGMALYINGRLPDAEKAYATAIQMEPVAADLHSSLGDVFFGSGRLQEAAAEYGTAIKLEPGNADYHNKAGRNQLRLDRTDLAEAEFNLAVGINPGHADALFNLGKIAASQGRTTEAVSLFSRAVASNPKSAEAQYQLALCYQRLGQSKEAVEALQRFRELKKQNP
jgi:tetratricopeptide (TPR) repeat protein